MASQVRNAGTGANDPQFGDVPWNSPEEATGVHNLSVAETDFGGNLDTNYLKLTNFGFSIPGATIDGIEVRMWLFQNDLGHTDDNIGGVFYKAGSLVEDSGFAGSGNDLPFSESVSEYQVYGGPTQLGGTTWTPADINNAGFGIGYACFLGAGIEDSKAYADDIEIEVFYTENGGGGGGPSVDPDYRRFPKHKVRR